MIDVFTQPRLASHKCNFPQQANIALGGDNFSLSWIKVTMRQNPLQNFSFSFHCMCDDRLLIYKFISIFHILLPGIPSFLSQSAEEMRQVLAEESFMTNKTCGKHGNNIFFSSFSKIIPNKDKNKSYKHCNNTFKWKHTIIYPQCAETSNLLQMVKKNACLPSVRQSATLSNTQLYSTRHRIATRTVINRINSVDNVSHANTQTHFFLFQNRDFRL